MSFSRIIKEKALELGFVAAGISSPEPFQLYAEELAGRPEMYEWGRGLSERASVRDLDLTRFVDPRRYLPEVKSLIVVTDSYWEEAFPPSLSGKIGRCYLKGLFCPEDNLPKRRRKEFRDFLQGLGMKTIYGPAPARLAGARAGVTHYGKNCFAFANEAAGQSSWVVNEPYLVDRELEPDSATLKLGCPENCRKCLDACPTGALYAPLKMDPRRCIAYLSYFTDGEIPRPNRPKMGTWVYGCDRCQEACPRNAKWMEKSKPVDEALAARAGIFSSKPCSPCLRSTMNKRSGLWFITSARRTVGSGSETRPWPWATWGIPIKRPRCLPLSTIRTRSSAFTRSGPWENWGAPKPGRQSGRSAKPTNQNKSGKRSKRPWKIHNLSAARKIG